MKTAHRVITARFRLVLLILVSAGVLSSCTSLLTGTIIKPTVGNLRKQQDIELVCDGAASYLLMIDSLIENSPDNRELLVIGIQSYGGAVAAFESCEAPRGRIDALSLKAKLYGQKLLARLLPDAPPEGPAAYELLAELTPTADTAYLFWGTFGWLTWVAQQQGSPASMADMVTIETLMREVLNRDETIENGSPHLFFGILYGAKPEMFGGLPAKSRAHFEKALEISNRTFLMVHVAFAETYCRMIFDRELHDRLLNEVLAFPLEAAPDNMLSNQIAKRKARRLLEENFFGD